MLVCADDTEQAHRAAEHLAEMAWQRRHEFEPELMTLADAIHAGLGSEGVTVVSDAGDAPTGGSAADSAAVLKGLLAAGADRADRLSYLTLCDPAAVQKAMAAGPGMSVNLAVGHAFSTADGSPVAIAGIVRLVSDGEYRLVDGGANGLVIKMGPCAVIAIGAIRLLLRSAPSMEWDTGMYLSQGLDPRQAALVFVKSPSHFRVAFGPLARRILVADTPGPTAANMRRIPFTRVTRPLFPLDPI